MNELKKMNRWLKIVALWIVVFFGLFFLEEFAAWLRTGLEAVCNCFTDGGILVEATNYSVRHASITRQHGLLQTFFWTFIVWGLIKMCKGKRIKARFGYFVVFMLVSMLLLELVHYAAYLVEFIGDAVISGITSREPNLTLKNIISLSRWRDVDWVSRACEAYILSRIFSSIGVVIERREYCQAFENAKSARANAEREVHKLEKLVRQYERKEWRYEVLRKNHAATTEAGANGIILLPGGETNSGSEKG